MSQTNRKIFFPFRPFLQYALDDHLLPQNILFQSGGQGPFPKYGKHQQIRRPNAKHQEKT